jgi:hypothetical protein
MLCGRLGVILGRASMVATKMVLEIDTRGVFSANPGLSRGTDCS